MPKMTLLEMTQDILNDMDADSVNSITDTIESNQVSQILKTTFFELIEGRTWPHLQERVQLTGAADSTKPTHLAVHEQVQEILWIKYDVASSTDTNKKYIDITYLEPDEFLTMSLGRASSATNTTVVVDTNSTEFIVYNDRAPTYWTSFDDENVVFDSHDSTVDATIQTSKNSALVYKSPTWSMLDAAVPDLPSKAFPLFLAEAKSSCFASLRQAPHPKEEQKARRQNMWLARNKWKTNRGIRYPNYGRK